MAGMAVDGLISGLSTSQLINQLMQVEALGQTALKNRVTANDRVLTALRSVNTRFTAVQTAAQTLRDAPTWSAATATTTGDAVTATATGAAAAGARTITVTSVAAAHSTYSDVLDRDAAASVTLHRGETSTTFSGDSLDELVAAVNADAELGVRASAVQTAPGQWRLQLTAAQTGAEHAFTTSGTATTVGVQGADTHLTVDGLPVSRPTTTITDVVPGLAITARAVGTATVDVAPDTSKLADAVNALVTAANAALSDMKTRSAYDTTARTGGPLTGNGVVRQLTADVLRAVTSGGDAALAGIQTTRDGTITFDRDAFLKAYADDPAAVRTALAPTEVGAQGLAHRLDGLATSATRTVDGRLTSAIAGVESRSKDLTRQIESWDVRLEMRRSTLQRQYAALEVALGSMQNQSQWLAGQINGLPRWETR